MFVYFVYQALDLGPSAGIIYEGVNRYMEMNFNVIQLDTVSNISWMNYLEGTGRSMQNVASLR